jgi:enoyl-CoA hydratase
MIYAAEDAVFGCPEIKIGTIPGAGGTQRLARALGKHKVRIYHTPCLLKSTTSDQHCELSTNACDQTMEYILTGASASGVEFERLGVINKVFPKEEVLAESMKLATKIAMMSAPVVAAAKQAILTG